MDTVKIARSVVVGLVAVTSFALVAACGDKGNAASPTASSAAPSPTKSLTAAERFAAAATKTGGTTYKFNATATEGTYSGATDPAAGVTTGTIAVDAEGLKVRIESRVTPTAYFVKISGLPLPGFDGSKWLKVDPAKITSKKVLSFGGVNDPTGLKVVAADVATVETADGKQFKGTLDLTKEAWGAVDADAVKALGDKAKAVPFEATVDDQGSLTMIKVTVPAHGSGKASETTVTYSEFGAPVTVATPAAAEVMDAPSSVYELLNSE